MRDPLAAWALLAAAFVASPPAAAQPEPPRAGALSPQQQGQQPEAEPRPGTVAWFLRNPDARRAAVARCEDDAGRLRDTRECVNALEARDKTFFGVPDLPTTEGRRF